MKGIKDNVAKVILWLSGYLNIIVFALTGGYVWLKSDNDELKNETKKIFIVTLIFTLIDILLRVYYIVMSMANRLSGDAYKLYSTLSNISSLAKIAVFLIFGLIAFFSASKKDDKKVSKDDKKQVEEK